MLLSDRDLRHAIHSGRLGIDPYEPELVQPSSIDLRLDRHLLLWPLDGHAIDPAQEPHMRRFEIADGDTFALSPGGMALASTVEWVRLAVDLACRVEGKSSLARLGLAAHITAGFIDPGFAGHITLELVNHAPRPILLRPGMRIAQLCAMPMLGKVERVYGASGAGSHYQNQRGPTPSRAHIGWHTWPTGASR
ncbi:dCTP deaminase [Plantactinospora sp. WMMB782]|uniref:dCTP deaminase n=1 Tax=Plantactinospora sp. WMMB782 TaxID=3404121 RepID=UPI003B947917